MCMNMYIDNITNAEWNIVPVDDDKASDPDVQEHCDEVRNFLEHLPSEESFDVILAKMIPDWKLYDAGTILKVYPRWAYDENGYFMTASEIKEMFGTDTKVPVMDLTVKDGRSFTIEAPPVGGRIRRYWQYSWMSPTSIPTPFDVREIMYFQDYPSSRGVYGTSNLETIQHVVNYLLDTVHAGSKFYENGMFIGGQIDHPDVQDPDELKRRAKMYKSQLGGVDKYNKWITTGGNVKITPLQFTAQQMQAIDHQQWYAKIVMGIFKVSPVELGFCYSDDTRTLTENGFKHYWEWQKGEKIAAVNPDTHELEYIEPTGLHIFDVEDREFHHYKTQQADVMVSANHKMYYAWGRKENQNWKLEESEKIHHNRIFFLKSIKWNGNNDVIEIVIPVIKYDDNANQEQQIEKHILMDVWLEFLGYYLSEGSVLAKMDEDHNYMIRISQKPGEKADKILACLNKMPYKWNQTYSDKKDSITFYISDKSLAKFLQPLGNKYQKYIPKEIKNLPPEKLQILLDALILGDGHNRCNIGNSTDLQYYSISERLRDDVAEIMLKCGRSILLNTKMNHGYSKNIIYQVNSNLHIKSTRIDRNKHLQTQKYTGAMYCFSLPKHHLFITERNGKIGIHSNTDDLQRATAIQQANLQKSKAIYPTMAKLERMLNKYLIWSDFYHDVKFQFVRSRDLDDEMKQLSVWQGQYQLNLLSVNQILREMGKDPWQVQAFDAPMVVEQQMLNPVMPQEQQSDDVGGQFDREGSGSDTQSKNEVLEGEKMVKAVNVGASSGTPGFGFQPKVWDGQRFMRQINPVIKRTQKELEEDLENTRKKILADLESSYGKIVSERIDVKITEKQTDLIEQKQKILAKLEKMI